MSEVSLVDGHIDNGMSDEDIIKAVDKCASIGESCEDCPFYDYTDCDKRLKEKFHSLINRQKTEIKELVGKIDRLKEENKKLKNEMSYMSSPNRIGDRHEMGCW